MTLAKDLSGLPKSQSGGNDAWAPDAEIRFGHLLLDRWHREDVYVPVAVEGARFRHSNGGKCSRLLAYVALGIPASDPMDVTGHFATHLGTYIHDQWQEELERVFPDAEIEVTVGEGERAGHIDVVVKTVRSITEDLEPQPWVTAIEAKSVGGFAFKKAIGIPPAGRTPHGPGYDHVIQASLNAKARDADEAVVLYFSKESVSHNIAKDRKLSEYHRTVGEWTLDRETYTAIADKEIARVEAILAMVDDGVLPARKIPSPELPVRHLITNPGTGEWVSANDEGVPEDAGAWWGCSYCSHQSICVQTPATRAAIAEVPVIVDLLAKEES